jgi:poly(A) polymerase
MRWPSCEREFTIEAGFLRPDGEPLVRFSDDPLLQLRAVRLAAQLDLALDPAAAAAIRRLASLLGALPDVAHGAGQKASREGLQPSGPLGATLVGRVAEELRLLLTNARRSDGMRLFKDLGLAAVVLPELLPMCGLPQGLPRAGGPVLPPPGKPGRPAGAGEQGDLWQHVLLVLDLLPETPSFPLALAALLHDVGKPRTVGRKAERYTFYGHEHVGRRMAGEIARRLHLSDEERERVEWLVEKHQVLADAPNMRPAKLDLVLGHPGIEELFDLHRADALASGRPIEHVEFAQRRLAERGATVPH